MHQLQETMIKTDILFIYVVVSVSSYELLSASCIRHTMQPVGHSDTEHNPEDVRLQRRR